MKLDIKVSPLSGGGGKQEVQIRAEEVHSSMFSTLLTARCENPDLEVMNEPVDPNTCSKVEDSDKDTYLEGELAPHQKHSISMEVSFNIVSNFHFFPCIFCSKLTWTDKFCFPNSILACVQTFELTVSFSTL